MTEEGAAIVDQSTVERQNPTLSDCCSRKRNDAENYLCLQIFPCNPICLVSQIVCDYLDSNLHQS